MRRVAKKNARRAERGAAPYRKICRGRRQDELRRLQKKTWALAIRIISRKFPPGSTSRIPGRGSFSVPLPVSLPRRTEKKLSAGRQFYLAAAGGFSGGRNSSPDKAPVQVSRATGQQPRTGAPQKRRRKEEKRGERSGAAEINNVREI